MNPNPCLTKEQVDYLLSMSFKDSLKNEKAKETKQRNGHTVHLTKTNCFPSNSIFLNCTMVYLHNKNVNKISQPHPRCRRLRSRRQCLLSIFPNPLLQIQFTSSLRL